MINRVITYSLHMAGPNYSPSVTPPGSESVRCLHVSSEFAKLKVAVQNVDEQPQYTVQHNTLLSHNTVCSLFQFARTIISHLLLQQFEKHKLGKKREHRT